MDEIKNKNINDVDALLKELEQEEVPAMTEAFEKQAMGRIIERKKELDAEDEKNSRVISLRWRRWISIAAVFVFLFGGTLLTRGSFRNTPVMPGTPSAVTVPKTSQPEEGQRSEVALFFEDMGLFVKAALPYLAGAGAVAAALLIIRKKKTKQ